MYNIKSILRRKKQRKVKSKEKIDITWKVKEREE